MRQLLLINHALIALFGIASGGYKITGGEADVRVFSSLGMTATMTAVFGAVQLVAALLTVPVRTRMLGAYLLAACNLLATAGLFAAGEQPFATISILFVVMALLVTRHTPKPAPQL